MRQILWAAVTALLIKPAAVKAADIAPVQDTRINSPREDLRLKLFGETAKQPSCLPVKATPRGALNGLDQDLETFLKQLIEAMQAQKDTALQPLFHKRLNTSLTSIAEVFARINHTYGAPVDISLARLWALNTADGTPKELTCGDDGITLYPMYGYPLQFAAWLQIAGKTELGRIYLSIVPADGRWNLGAFHTQQWTHAGKDYAAWGAEAETARKAGLREAAWVKFDIAAKLLDGGRFLTIGVKPELEASRDAVMKRDDWSASVRSAIKGHEVIKSASLFVVDGAGILVAVAIKEEISGNLVKSRCQDIARQLATTPWAKDLAGVRCSFYLPGEDTTRDSATGGLYLTFSESSK